MTPPAFAFTITHTDPHSRARAGLLTTPHGTVETPAFVPVATQATVKALTPDDLRAIGVQAVMANTYHLWLRPGADLIARLGGLHRFMAWDGPLMTDSGGFQVFSLGFGIEHGVGKIASVFPGEGAEGQDEANREARSARRTGQGRLVHIDEDGVTFTSHLDGSTRRLTPELAMQAQELLGADVVLVLDECTSPLNDLAYTRRALERTHRWARRGLDARTRKDQALFGIVQGGHYQELRETSARFIGGLPFDGLALGGDLGRSKADMHQVLEWTVPLLPEGKPRHLLGIGAPEDILEAVLRGVDTFDCAAPTRLARNGTLLTHAGAVHIMNAEHTTDPRPVQEGCPCQTCSHFSRAYLRHLFKAEELLGPRLATVHNLRFMADLMRQVRQAIRQDGLGELRAAFLAGYGGK